MTRRSIIMLLTMTLLMGLILSAVFTIQDTGMTGNFVSNWLRRFAGTYVLVLPTVLIVAPLAERISSALDRRIETARSPRDVALAAWQANADGHAGKGFDSWLSHLAEDVVISMPLGQFRGETHGIGGATAICKAIEAAHPQLVYEAPLRITESAQTIVIEFDDHGTIANAPYRNRIAASFDVKGDRVAAYREYFGDVDPQIVALMSATSAGSADQVNQSE